MWQGSGSVKNREPLRMRELTADEQELVSGAGMVNFVTDVDKTVDIVAKSSSTNSAPQNVLSLFR
jgi:hypothetical protein